MESCIRVANLVKNIGQVVRYQSVAAPLSKETEEHRNQHSLSHTLRAYQVHPRLIRILEFHFNGGLNLRELGGDNDGVSVTFSMILYENVERFLSSVLGDQPARALRDEAASC